MKTKFQSAAGAVRRNVTRTTLEETLGDSFLDLCEAVQEKVQHLSYKFLKYVVKNLVAAGTLDSILALIFDRRVSVEHVY